MGFSLTPIVPLMLKIPSLQNLLLSKKKTRESFFSLTFQFFVPIHSQGSIILNFKEDPKNRFYSIDWKKIQLFFLGTLIPLLSLMKPNLRSLVLLNGMPSVILKKKNESPNPSCPKLSIN